MNDLDFKSGIGQRFGGPLFGMICIVIIVSVLIPSILIGGCNMKTMACQSITFPAFYLISSILIIYSVINIYYLIKSEKVKNEKEKKNHN